MPGLRWMQSGAAQGGVTAPDPTRSYPRDGSGQRA